MEYSRIHQYKNDTFCAYTHEPVVSFRSIKAYLVSNKLFYISKRFSFKIHASIGMKKSHHRK